MSSEYWRRRILHSPIMGGVDWPFPFNQIAWWFEQVWTWLGGIWDYVSSNIWNGINEILRVLPGWFFWVRDRVNEKVGEVWSWIEDKGNWVKDRIWEFVRDAWIALADLGNSTWSLVGQVRDSLGTYFQNLTDGIGADFGILWGQLGDLRDWIALQWDNLGLFWTNTMLPYLEDVAMRNAENMGLIDRGVGDRIEDAKQWFASQITDPWTDWLRSTATQFIGGIQATWNSVTNWLSGAWTWALGILNGPVLDAATGALGWLGDRLGDAASAAFGVLEGYLGSWSPVKIDEVPNKVRDMVLRLGAGVAGLGLMTVGGELLHPLKNLGLGRVAAMIYNFTRYDTIVDSYVRPLTQASIGIPLRWYFNDFLRPWRPAAGDLQRLYGRNFIDEATFRQGMAYQGYPDDWIEAYAQMAVTIPSEGTLGVMYAKKEINEAKLRETLDRWGFSPEWQDVYTRHLWLDPRLGEIIRISQISPPTPEPDPRAIDWLNRAGIALGDPTLWWYTYKLAKAGYEPVDIPVLVGVARMGVVRREQTMYFEAARRLRRDGFISDSRYEQLIAEAWVAKDPVRFRRDATALDVEYDRKESLAMITRRTYSRGALSEGEALSTLAALGMDGVAARIALLEEKVGLLPRTRVQLATVAAEGDLGGD